MAKSIFDDDYDFLYWLIVFVFCAPLAIIWLAWEILGQRKKPEKPAPQGFYYE
jgi:hypothetical protein